MVVSMTGFGDAQLERAGHAYHLEIRSVNHRYFKAALRLPEDFAFLEPDVESLLRRRISRGSLAVRLDVRDLSAAAAADINTAALRHYLAQLMSILSTEARYTIDLATLATLPGVCQPHELAEQEREEVTNVVHTLLDGALQRMIAMRTIEGQALAEDLVARCATIRENIEGIRARVPVVVDEYRLRLHARIQQLIAGSSATLAEQDLIKEVAIYAERSDISEELSRLASHLDQFATAMRSPEPAGRKLDFIAQEMLREANTIGSKASDADIVRRVIDVKGAIDRLKEQLQNVE